jgi:hypothetical protein
MVIAPGLAIGFRPAGAALGILAGTGILLVFAFALSGRSPDRLALRQAAVSSPGTGRP